MADMKNLKSNPYGISDFELFRNENYYYVDKTRYIRNIEEKGRYIFLIRPRRFGKSLFLSILESYYDIALKDKFDNLFKETYIYDNPTEERNKYLILKFNFSRLEPGVANIEDAFLKNIKNAVSFFIKKYGSILDIDADNVVMNINSIKNAAGVMDTLLYYCQGKEKKVYVIIDEYDNFANTILSTSGEKAFRDITHGEGFFRAFFNVLKGGTSDVHAPISRIFMTGVSPITLDDVTSGFNIAINISLDSDIDNIMGFTRSEVETMIEYFRQTGKIRHSTSELIRVMSQWYNHYRFSMECNEEVFNTVHILYFLKAYLKNSRIPIELIDRNAQIDYNKLRYLIIIDKKGTPGLNGNFSKLQSIIETNSAKTFIKEGFPAERLIEQDNFYSLLYYFGLLTICGVSPSGQAILTIPNEFVKRLYFDYIKEAYRTAYSFSIDMGVLSNLFEEMAFEGKWEAVITYIAQQMQDTLSIRDLMSGEKAHQVFWNVYLGLNSLYSVYSEKELNQGFSDLVLEPFLIRYPGIKYSYIIELKYIKSFNDSSESIQRLTALKEEAVMQLNRYSTDAKFQKLFGSTILKKLVLVFSGNRMIYHGEVE